MIQQAKSNPQLLDEQIFSERLYPRFLLLAQSVSLRGARPCPELGVKPTCRLNARTSHFDPIQTWAANLCCDRTTQPLMQMMW